MNGLGRDQAVPIEILRAHALEHRAMRSQGIQGLGAVDASLLSRPGFWLVVGTGVAALGLVLYFNAERR